MTASNTRQTSGSRYACSHCFPPFSALFLHSFCGGFRKGEFGHCSWPLSVGFLELMFGCFWVRIQNNHPVGSCGIEQPEGGWVFPIACQVRFCRLLFAVLSHFALLGRSFLPLVRSVSLLFDHLSLVFAIFALLLALLG